MEKDRIKGNLWQHLSEPANGVDQNSHGFQCKLLHRIIEHSHSQKAAARTTSQNDTASLVI